jgi:hypothetical protein
MIQPRRQVLTLRSLNSPQADAGLAAARQMTSRVDRSVELLPIRVDGKPSIHSA